MIIPSPPQASHLPPFTLKLKLPLPYPRSFASGSCENRSLICVNTPVYVAGFDLGVLPIGAWLISMILSMFCSPFMRLYLPGFSLLSVHLSSNSLVQYLVDQTALSRARYSCNAYELAQRYLHIYPLQIILGSALDLQEFSVAFSPRFGNFYPFLCPLRYWPVMDSGQFMMSSTVP